MIERDPSTGISGSPRPDNIMIWDAVIFGPEGTPFEGGIFKLTIQFNKDHPFQPPEVKFVSKMFHPNISENSGKVFVDILKSTWTPALNASALLVSIQSLLNDPNPDVAINKLAGHLFRTDQAEYLKRVRQCVEQSWTVLDEVEQVEVEVEEEVDVEEEVEDVEEVEEEPQGKVTSNQPQGGQNLESLREDLRIERESEHLVTREPRRESLVDLHVVKDGLNRVRGPLDVLNIVEEEPESGEGFNFLENEREMGKSFSCCFFIC